MLFDRIGRRLRITPGGACFLQYAQVICGLGIAVLPYRMIQGALERGLVVTISAEGMDFRRSFSIIYHRSKHLTQAAEAFLELCRNYELDYPLPKYTGLL